MAHEYAHTHEPDRMSACTACYALAVPSAEVVPTIDRNAAIAAGWDLVAAYRAHGQDEQARTLADHLTAATSDWTLPLTLDSRGDAVTVDGTPGHDRGDTTPTAPGRFTPSYPRLFAEPGERCHKVQHRTGGRVSLQCVRRVHGPDVHHLMDIMDRDAR